MSHHTSGTSLHYLMKYLCSEIAMHQSWVKNSQNDRLCIPAATKKKDVTKRLHTQLTFSHWWHQSASHKWLTLHCSLSLVTCRSRRQGYWGILIVTWCCYYTRLISSEFFICQQDSAPPHRALEPINFSPITLPNAELFQKFFQNRLSNTFVIRQWINFSSRLNHIATRCGVSLIIIAYMFQVVSVFPTSIFHKVV